MRQLVAVRGQNLLGFALMEVRSLLRKAEKQYGKTTKPESTSACRERSKL